MAFFRKASITVSKVWRIVYRFRRKINRISAMPHSRDIVHYIMETQARVSSFTYIYVLYAIQVYI